LIFPWEHTSLPDLISAERLRFGITEAQLERANEILESQLGTGVSARNLRRYEHEGERVPRTAVLLGLALIHSLRFTDVLRILNLWTDESRDYSPATLMSARTNAELPSGFQLAKSPQPVALWQPFLDEWGEWPTLLSMAIPDLERWGRRILRINQSAWFKGLEPFIVPHSVVVLDEQDVLPPPTVYRRSVLRLPPVARGAGPMHPSIQRSFKPAIIQADDHSSRQSFKPAGGGGQNAFTFFHAHSASSSDGNISMPA